MDFTSELDALITIDYLRGAQALIASAIILYTIQLTLTNPPAYYKSAVNMERRDLG